MDAMRRVPLPIVDALALMLFVVAGIAGHDETSNVLNLFLRNAVPLLASWFVVARFTGAYRRPGIRSMLAIWAIAVPAGLLLRTAWVGSPAGGALLVFLVIGLVFTLLFLLVGRGAERVLDRRGAPDTPGVVR
jgi:hypothetical protein